MNPLGEVLRVDDILLDIDVSSRVQLLERLASLLAGRLALPEAQVLESLSAREQLGSTALGHGVAIPHARMNQCTAEAAAFVRTRLPLPFDAPDGKPVSIFLALVVPKQATQRHLQLLAAAAGMLGDRTVRDMLKASHDPSAVRSLLVDWHDRGALAQGGANPAA